MAAKTTKTAKPTYTFRASWAVLLLIINFVVAGYYFGLIK